MMNQELQQITHRSDMYDIVSENWLHMETVLKETPFMSRYDHAEERRSALSVLWTYFDRNCELLSLLNLEEFKKSTNQLLNDFLGERLAELLYLVVPMKKENICMDCVDLEISNQIQELVRKKPKVQAIPFKENYSQEPLWLNDDILSHVLSYLIFPREIRSISLTCKRLYYFLHYSTNFSWISHLTLPNQGKIVRQDTVVLHDSLSVDVVSFIQRLFKTYQGFTNISSISKIFNYFHEHPENGRNTFLLHKLLKKENTNNGTFETNFDTLFIHNNETWDFWSYYWLIKRRKNVPLKKLIFGSLSKCFGFMMVLKNASRFVSDHTSDLADIEIVNGNNLIALRSFKLLNHDLDLTETGLPVCGRNILLSCLPGVEDQYFDRIVLLHSFDLDDDISWIRSTIPKFRNDLVIHRVYANKYYPDLVQVLKDMENKGITIHTIILSDCYKQFKEHEKKELLKLKSRIDISQSYSSDSIPPTDTWTLKSVIQ